MEKLKKTANPMDLVLAKVRDLCPAAVQGDKIDFERLRSELEPSLSEENETYNFTWVGKRDAILGATLPVGKTLRPDVESSKNWDETKNLYIEGDNLDVLKLLQESYLGKVKMIYIDPPYNTGNDFVYCDNFAEKCKEYMDKKGQCDVETNERLFKNDESNGRYHSNWCTMIYPRLKVARDLLSDDGVIFISIDDNEVANLRKICDEVFGMENFVAQVVWERAYAPINLKKHFSNSHDYIVCYAKNIDLLICNGLPRTKNQNSDYKNIDNDPRGPWKAGNPSVGPAVEKNIYEIISPAGKVFLPPSGRSWLYSKDKFAEMLSDNRIYWGKDGNSCWAPKMFLNEVKQGVTPMTIWKYSEVGHSQDATKSLKEIFDGFDFFDYPKPVDLLKRCIALYSNTDSIVLDFFSGSATTAHAVMQLNAEDGGNRRFIMVQLPEQTDEKSEAFKAGYKNICEIGKERIRRAGDKIMAEHPESKLDIGFKVFKLDEPNMKTGIFNEPSAQTQAGLFENVENIVDGRTSLDLLYDSMIKLGLTLDLDVKTVQSGDTEYFNVDSNSLIACFADQIPESIVHEIAAMHPLRVVFRDSSFANDAAKINVTEIFKTISPNTKITVL